MKSCAAILFVTALAVGPARAEEELRAEWSGTFEVRSQFVDSPEDDDDVTGFFDQYEFVPNKGDSPQIELGVSELDFDLFGAEETPRVQFRLRSPTSNVGVSGDDAGSPFLNQRGLLLLRPDGLAIDLDYRRFRTEDLRLFPNPLSPFSIGSQFNDATSSKDVFDQRRTFFDGEVRFRSERLGGGEGGALGSLSPEIALRGGYGERHGGRQTRFLLDLGEAPFADLWRAIESDVDQSVADMGGGLLVAPGGLFTLVLDFDHQRFRNDASTVTMTDLGPPAFPGPNTVQFIPDTNRYTGTARVQGRLGERAVFHAGFQATQLEQVDDRTPNQVGAAPDGLRNNEIRFYSANFGSDVQLSESFSLNTFFKYDFRDNQIERDTSLFNPGGGSQVAEFLKDVRWFRSGAELAYRPYASAHFALGYRNEWIDRNTKYSAAPSIRPDNALLHDETRIHSVYVSSRLRPARRLNLSGEIGYRRVPKTGYITDLDQVGYGNVRASYSLPFERPVTLSLFGRGEFGRNHHFEQNSEAAGVADPDRDFKREQWSYGLTITGSPTDDITLFSSFFQHLDAQDYDLVRSSSTRYSAPPVNFIRDSPLDYRSDLINALFGSHFQLTRSSDLAVSYSFTRSNTRFRDNNTTAATLRPPSRIRSEIHSADVEVGHWVQPGLRVGAGYRLQRYDDQAPLPPNGGSVVAPFDLSTWRHTVSLAVTVTSDLLGKN
jgi:hypothetical protein